MLVMIVQMKVVGVVCRAMSVVLYYCSSPSQLSPHNSETRQTERGEWRTRRKQTPSMCASSPHTAIVYNSHCLLGVLLLLLVVVMEF